MIICLSCILGKLLGLEEKKVKAYILDINMPQQRCRYNKHLTNQMAIHEYETSKNYKCGAYDYAMHEALQKVKGREIEKMRTAKQ